LFIYSIFIRRPLVNSIFRILVNYFSCFPISPRRFRLRRNSCWRLYLNSCSWIFVFFVNRSLVISLSTYLIMPFSSSMISTRLAFRHWSCSISLVRSRSFRFPMFLCAYSLSRPWYICWLSPLAEGLRLRYAYTFSLVIFFPCFLWTPSLRFNSSWRKTLVLGTGLEDDLFCILKHHFHEQEFRYRRQQEFRRRRKRLGDIGKQLK